MVHDFLSENYQQVLVPLYVNIDISTFDDCLYLLDGDLNQLSTLIFDIDIQSVTLAQKKKLFESQS